VSPLQLGGLPVASAVCGRAVANSASLPDAPIAAVALPWALLLGRFDPRVETQVAHVERARVLGAQADVFHDCEGPVVQMVLQTDPEWRPDSLCAVVCEPLAWLRGDVGTARPDARLGALDGIVALPGGYVGHTSLARLLAGGFRTATRTFACAFKVAETTINIPDNKASAEIQVFVVEAKGNEVSVAAPAASVGKWDTRRGAPVGRHRGPRFDAHLGGSTTGSTHRDHGTGGSPHEFRSAVPAAHQPRARRRRRLDRHRCCHVWHRHRRHGRDHRHQWHRRPAPPALPGPIAAAASIIRPSSSAPSSARPVPSFPRPPPTTTTL